MCAAPPPARPLSGAARVCQRVDRRIPARGEVLAARAVRRGIRRVDLGQPRCQRCAHAQDVARVGVDVRVAGGVDIAVGAVEPCGFVPQRHKPRRLEIAGADRAAPLALPASRSSTGSQPISSSAPVHTTRSARRICAIRLGRASIRCGSCKAVVAA